MRRGDCYRVSKPGGNDPKASRVFAVASRQAAIDSRFATAICVPVYSARHGLATQVPVGIDEGLKHESSLHCDELVSLPKARLTSLSARSQRIKVARTWIAHWIAALDIDASINLFD